MTNQDRFLRGSLLPILGLTAGLLLASGCDSDDDDTPANEDAVSVEVEEGETVFYEAEVPEDAEYFEIGFEVTEGDAFVRLDHPTGSAGAGRVEGAGSTWDFDDPTAGTYAVEVETWNEESGEIELNALIEPDDLTIELVETDGSRGEALATAPVMSETDFDLRNADEALAVIRGILDLAADQEPGTTDYAIERDGERIGSGSVHRDIGGSDALIIGLQLPGQHVVTHGGHSIVIDDAEGHPRSGQLHLRDSEGEMVIRLGDDTGTHDEIEVLHKPGHEVKYTSWDAFTTDIEVVRK